MFRTQSSEMRNLRAIHLRPPLPERMFVTFPFNNFTELRGHLLGEVHSSSTHVYGTCMAMDQSLILGCQQSPGAMISRTIERSRTARGSMLMTNQDSVKRVREHAVVTCI